MKKNIENKAEIKELMRHIDIPIIFKIDKNPLDNLVDILKEFNLEDKKFLITHGEKSFE